MNQGLRDYLRSLKDKMIDLSKLQLAQIPEITTNFPLSNITGEFEIDPDVAEAHELILKGAKANIVTSEQVTEINNKVRGIETGLSTEREERKAADAITEKFARKRTFWASLRAWIAIGISALALFLSVILN